MFNYKFDGSVKLDLWFLGNEFKFSVFEKETGQELGQDYNANPKFWMGCILFFQSTKKFDCSSEKLAKETLDFRLIIVVLTIQKRKITCIR